MLKTHRIKARYVLNSDQMDFLYLPRLTFLLQRGSVSASIQEVEVSKESQGPRVEIYPPSSQQTKGARQKQCCSCGWDHGRTSKSSKGDR
jgi:hypothetical protein